MFTVNPLLFIVLCLQFCVEWGMHVRCEHQCVSDLGLLLLLQLVFNVLKCHLLNMSPVLLNIPVTQQRSMLHIKTIPSIYGNGKQMKECDNTS